MNYLMISFFLLLGTVGLFAQSVDQETEEITSVFEAFFSSVRNRDTLAIKACIAYPHSSHWFFNHFSGNDQGLSGISSSTVSGFLKTVSVEDGMIGKCQNEFDSLDITIHQRFAIITAFYQCFVQDRLDNKGLYSVRFLKTDRWKIESLARYAERIE